MSTEPVADLLHGRTIHVQQHELGTWYQPPGVHEAFSRTRQLEEELLRRLALLLG